MEELKLGTVESKFADIIWENEPISSGQLVKLCGQQLDWKKKLLRNPLMVHFLLLLQHLRHEKDYRWMMWMRSRK